MSAEGQEGNLFLIVTEEPRMMEAPNCDMWSQYKKGHIAHSALALPSTNTHHCAHVSLGQSKP